MTTFNQSDVNMMFDVNSFTDSLKMQMQNILISQLVNLIVSNKNIIFFNIILHLRSAKQNVS